MSKHNENITGGNARRWQRGAIAPLAAILMIPLLSFLALAIDVGNRHVARNELQNAADAAALAGASDLYSLNPTSFPVTSFPSVTGTTTNVIGLNKVTNANLSTANGYTITTGYWDFASPLNSDHMKLLPHTPISTDYPAVKVTISKATNNNNGAVNTFFAKIFGVNSVDVSATAVAVLASAGYTSKNLFPMALSGCLFGLTGQGTGVFTPPNPLTFTQETPYPTGSTTCTTGEWTPLTSTAVNGNNHIKDLLDAAAAGGISSTAPSVGDPLWIQNGTRAVDYGMVHDTLVGTYQTVPIVCPTTGTDCTVVVGQAEKILAYVCILITAANQNGSHSTITMKYIGPADPNYQNCAMSGSGGVGPNYGTPMPPRLVNYSNNSNY